MHAASEVIAALHSTAVRGPCLHSNTGCRGLPCNTVEVASYSLSTKGSAGDCSPRAIHANHASGLHVGSPDPSDHQGQPCHAQSVHGPVCSGRRLLRRLCHRPGVQHLAGRPLRTLPGTVEQTNCRGGAQCTSVVSCLDVEHHCIMTMCSTTVHLKLEQRGIPPSRPTFVAVACISVVPCIPVIGPAPPLLISSPSATASS